MNASAMKDASMPAYERARAAIDLFQDSGRGIHDSSEPLRAMVMTVTAVGIIANGGWQFFFEKNFQGIDSYRHKVANKPKPKH